ncbi:hypothetical protein HK101_003689, partial [Irineochytrium annulatum]
MQKHRVITASRLANFIADGQFSDVNLLGALWEKKDHGEDAIAMEVYPVPDLKR